MGELQRAKSSCKAASSAAGHDENCEAKFEQDRKKADNDATSQGGTKVKEQLGTEAKARGDDEAFMAYVSLQAKKRPGPLASFRGTHTMKATIRKAGQFQGHHHARPRRCQFT